MENMNNVVMYEKTFKDQIKNNKTSKLIRKVIIGLTLAAGLTFTACGSSEIHYDKSVVAETYASYHDFESRYFEKFNIDFTDAEKSSMQAIYDWIEERSREMPDFTYETLGEKSIFSIFSSNAYHRLNNLVDSAQQLVIEDALKEIPDGAGVVKSEGCSIVSKTDKSGVHYYVSLESYNAFNDNSTVYVREIKSPDAIDMLNKCNMIISSGYTKAGYRKFNDEIGQTLNMDQMQTVYDDCTQYGDELVAAVENVMRGDTVFKNWKIDKEATAHNM